MQVGEKPLRTVINPKQFISLQGHTIILRQLEIQSTSPNSVHVIHLIPPLHTSCVMLQLPNLQIKGEQFPSSELD